MEFVVLRTAISAYIHPKQALQSLEGTVSRACMRLEVAVLYVLPAVIKTMDTHMGHTYGAIDHNILAVNR